MSLSICAVFKNEAPYLREWVEFHRIVGVEQFFLYDNRSNDDWKFVMRPYVLDGIVKINDWSTAPGQLAELGWKCSAYQHFIDNHSKAPDWVAFIDCDEFLFSPLERNLSDVLSQEPFCEYGAIGVNWMCFGAGTEVAFRPDPVMERFVLRLQATDRINMQTKSIVRMDCALGATTSPHCFRVCGGTRGEYGEYLKAGCLDGNFRFPPTHTYFRINHYLTKSREEWDRRHPTTFRPDTLRKERVGNFEGYQNCSVSDREILIYLPELRKRLTQ